MSKGICAEEMVELMNEEMEQMREEIKILKHHIEYLERKNDEQIMLQYRQGNYGEIVSEESPPQVQRAEEGQGVI